LETEGKGREGKRRELGFLICAEKEEEEEEDLQRARNEDDDVFLSLYVRVSGSV
jgi:hypothetical protein